MQTPGAAEAAKTAETLVLAVKPQDMGALLDEIAAFVPGFVRPAGDLRGGGHHHCLHRAPPYR